MGIGKENNITTDNIGEYTSACNFQPKRFHLLTSINIYSENSDIIIEDQDDSAIDEWQYVIAVGPEVKDYKPGDRVYLDLEKMQKFVKNPQDITKQIMTFDFKPFEIKDKVFTIISDNYILGKVFEYEDVQL